jgi:hypothetical protein
LLLLQSWQSHILSNILQFNVIVRYRVNKIFHLKTTISQLSPTSHQFNLRSVQHLFLTCISAIPWSSPLFLISSIRPVVNGRHPAHCTQLRVSAYSYFLTRFPNISVSLSGSDLSTDSTNLLVLPTVRWPGTPA